MTTPFGYDRFDPFAQLDQDWAHLVGRRHHKARVRRWAAEEPALADVERLEDFVTQDRGRRRRYFGPVLGLVRAGDELASRVLMQMLVPGLVGIVRDVAGRLTNPRTPLEDISCDVIAAAWHQTNALAAGRSSARTPATVLLNIRRDTIRWRRTLDDVNSPVPNVTAETEVADRPVVRRRHHNMRGQMVAVDFSAGTDQVETRLTLDQAVIDGVIDQASSDLIWRVTIEDQPVKEAAAEVGLTGPWACEKRHAALARLSTHLATAA